MSEKALKKKHFRFLGATLHKDLKYQEFMSIDGDVCVHLMEERKPSFSGHILKPEVYFDEK